MPVLNRLCKHAPVFEPVNDNATLHSLVSHVDIDQSSPFYSIATEQPNNLCMYSLFNNLNMQIGLIDCMPKKRRIRVNRQESREMADLL